MLSSGASLKLLTASLEFSSSLGESFVRTSTLVCYARKKNASVAVIFLATTGSRRMPGFINSE